MRSGGWWSSAAIFHTYIYKRSWVG